MDPKKTTEEATRIAELESELAIMKQDAEAQRLELESVKKDNETLLNVNKRLQLAVGLQEGDDAPPEDEQEKTKTSDELQDELVAKFIKNYKERQ